MLSWRKCWGRDELHQMIAVPTLMSTSMDGLRKDGDMLLPFPLLQRLLQCSEVWLDLGKNWKFSRFSKYYIKGKNDIKTRSNCVSIFSSFTDQIPSMSCVLHFLFPQLSFPSAELTSEIRVHNQYVNNQGVCSLHYTDIRGISSTVWWILWTGLFVLTEPYVANPKVTNQTVLSGYIPSPNVPSIKHH